MKPNLSSKLILVFFLVSLVVILFPTITKGSMSFVSNPTCGSHYGLISCDKYGCNLSYRGACLPWQTGEGKVYCGEEGCEFVFLGCNLNISCAKPPTNLRYYDNPNYPTSPFLPEESISANNIFLPVKLDWDDVEGWKDGWVDDKAKEYFQECRGYGGSPAQCTEQYLKTCLSVYDAEGASIKIGVCEEKCNEIGKTSLLSCGDNCDAEPTPITCQRMGYLCDAWSWRNKCKSECPEKCKNSINFYQIRIEGGLRDSQSLEEITEYKSFVDKSEFIPPSCLLKSNQSYQWQVRACVEENEQKCGPWSELETFTTNLAPEHVSPYDPDWAGKNGGKNVPVPVTLDWCDVNEAGSFQLKVYIMRGEEKVCHPSLYTTQNGEEFCNPHVLRITRRDSNQPERILYSDLLDEDMYFFTGNTTYLWEIAACLDDSGLDCKDYSRQWTFTTGEKTSSETFLTSPPNDPEGQKPFGLPLMLNWRKDAGINSWWYKLGSTQGLTTNSQSRSFDYPELSLNTSYQWQVLSCLDYEGNNCQDSWSEIYHFKTTGQAPNLIYPTPGANNISLPVNFDWNDVSGAESYIISIQGEGLNVEKTLTESGFALGFPEFPVRQETDYTWRVKTCAREGGLVCGEYSALYKFRTFRLSPPQNPSYPEDGGTFFTGEHLASWEMVSGAKAYQYQIKYLSLASDEKDENCSVLAGKDVFDQPRTTFANSDYAELTCLGEYQWQVRSCLDEGCQEFSNWSNSWIFTFSEGGTGQGGLIPCGRETNNPNTPWNEREPCQIKHLFLLIKTIIDFLLLRIIPIILVLLTIITGLIFYTSLGQIMTMAQVISLWKAAGVGLGIVFFAWTLVNIFLKLVGYNIGIFGNWYQF